jgi:dolichol-phosphate mannosyltransferase
MQAPDSRSQFALVIPTLNEAENIRPLLNRIHASLEPLAVPYEIIIVDDGSKDGTQEVAYACSAADPRVRLLIRNNEKGLAGAVIHGWRHTNAEFLGVIDADLQHPPEVLPALLAGIQSGADLAVGSRYTEQTSVPGWSFFRQAVSRFSTWVTLPFQRRVRVKDPMSGFFVLRRECIEGVRLQPEGFKILLEILVRGRIRSVVEVPFQFGLRHAGKSKADLRVAFHYFFLLGKLSRDLIFKGQQ